MMMENLVKPPVNSRQLRKKSYATKDIIQLVQEVLTTDRDDTEQLAKRIPKTKNGLKRLFNLVDKRFKYKEDPLRNQWVQTPSFLWNTRIGDCKSFTVFISSVLYNMGIDHIIRYVSYGTSHVTHVYPVALLDGKEYPLDVVFKKQQRGAFGQEKSYSKKIDKHVNAGLYKLGTVESDAMLSAAEENYLRRLEREFSDIPDEIVNQGPGDVTRMTKGQFNKFMTTQRLEIFAEKESNDFKRRQLEEAVHALRTGDPSKISGIGNTALQNQVSEVLAQELYQNEPAFESFTLEIPNPLLAVGFFKKIGKFVKKVANKVKDLFKKFTNWIFKGIGLKMSPYFLFIFLGAKIIKKIRGKKRREIERRKAQQEKTFKWIAEKGKLGTDKLMGITMNGIKKQTNFAPTQLLEAAGKKNSIGAAFAAFAKIAIKAIGFIIKVVGKIISLFKGKKKNSGNIGQDNMSDLGLVEFDSGDTTPINTNVEEGGKEFLERSGVKQTTTRPSARGGGGGGSNNMILPLALGAGALLFLKK